MEILSIFQTRLPVVSYNSLLVTRSYYQVKLKLESGLLLEFQYWLAFELEFQLKSLSVFELEFQY